jgi:periplasmic protein CpxP/Spy
VKTTITAIVASAFIMTGAYAQSPSQATDGAAMHEQSASRPMNSDADRSMHVDKHIADLKAQLKITSAEETQWDAVAQTMRDNANNIDKAMDKREDANGSAIDDLNAYGEVVQSHADGIKKLSAVFSTLYMSMSADQKRIADDVFAQRGHEGKKPVASN